MSSSTAGQFDVIKRAQLARKRDEEKRKAIELGKSGLDPATIAAQLGMPVFVVRTALVRAKVPLHPPRISSEAADAPRVIAPRRGPGRPPKLKGPAIVDPNLPRRGPGRPRKCVLPAAANPATIRRGPGRPRKNPVDAPPAPAPRPIDPQHELVAKHFSEYQSAVDIADGLTIPVHVVRYVLNKLPESQRSAWKELVRLRREVNRLIIRRR